MARHKIRLCADNWESSGLKRVWKVQTPIYLSLYQGVFNILKITTTTHNDIVSIVLIQNLLIATPNIYIYAERGQSQLSNGIRVWGSRTESS
jgi:hypothetical protein